MGNLKKQGRRSILAQWMLGLLTAVAPGDAKAANPPDHGALQKSGEPVITHLRQGEPPVHPLDTMLLFERGDDNNDRAMTHEVLSLIHQEKGSHSFPWTLYASLETHHEVGDACVVCSRLHKYGPGWSAGLHSEVFSHARAVALGANIEMSSDYTGPDPTEAIGLNIQAVEGALQYGIQIHDNHGHFQTGIGLNGRGAAGIDLKGDFTLGINTHANHIRLNEGACIELDGQGLIRMRYQNGRLEFLNGERCFGHLDINGEDHRL